VFEKGSPHLDGQANASLEMLRKAIKGNYCSYPAMDSDPFFASVRGKPEWADIRFAAIRCQSNFRRSENSELGYPRLPPRRFSFSAPPVSAYRVVPLIVGQQEGSFGP
jgi:hypothetical protein